MESFWIIADWMVDLDSIFNGFKSHFVKDIHKEQVKGVIEIRQKDGCLKPNMNLNT